MDELDYPMTGEIFSSKQPGLSTFVTKLYEMVQNDENHDIIHWVLGMTNDLFFRYA